MVPGLFTKRWYYLHIENIYGDNSHHIIESCFKGLARALRLALVKDARAGDSLPSTKGIL